MGASNPTTPFYDMFKKLCEEKNVSLTQALNDMHLSSSYITLWKKRGPGESCIRKISEYFHKGIEELFPEGRYMPFTAEELRLLRLYRGMNKIDQSIVLGVCLFLKRTGMLLKEERLSNREDSE